MLYCYTERGDRESEIDTGQFTDDTIKLGQKIIRLYINLQTHIQSLLNFSPYNIPKIENPQLTVKHSTTNKVCNTVYKIYQHEVINIGLRLAKVSHRE